MSLPNGSASATERLIACPSWVVLPRVDRTSDDARAGRARHAYIAEVLSGADPKRALADVPEGHRATCAGIEWRKIGGDLAHVETELAFALDVRARTARFLGTNIHRDYAGAARRAGEPLGEWEIPGSLDVTGVQRAVEGRRVVVDVKGPHAEVTPAAENGQGLFFSAVYRLSLGLDGVEFRIAKLKESGAVWLDSAYHDAFQIDDYLDQLESAVEQSHEARRVYLAGGTPDVVEGPHCQYCPAVDACPAKTALARAMLPELADVAARVETLTVAQVGAAWELAHDRIKPLLEAVLKPLKERIRREGRIPLPSGKEARVSEYTMDRFDKAAALALLERLGATAEELRSCTQSTQVVKVMTGNPPKARAKGRAA